MKSEKTRTWWLVCLLTSCVGSVSAMGCAVEGVANEEGPAPEVVASVRQGLGDACKDTEITIINSRERNGVRTRIKLEYVEYYSVSEGRWYVEGLDDAEIVYGGSRTWSNQDLEHAENDLISRWKAFYRYLEADGDWSDRVYQEINTPDEACHADDNFSLSVQ